MKRQFVIMATAAAAMIAVVCWSAPQQAVSQTEKSDAVKLAYEAYVQAWKTRNIAALQQLISTEYMAMNFESKLSDKENEIATAKADAEWISMSVDEIHARVFGEAAIASGLLSVCAGQTTRWDRFQRKSAIPGCVSESRPCLATCRNAIDPHQPR